MVDCLFCLQSTIFTVKVLIRGENAKHRGETEIERETLRARERVRERERERERKTDR